MIWYHGGKAGLDRGGILVPSPPVATDGCPVCVARREGRTFTVGEYRAWAETLPGSERLLAALEGAPDSAPMDPPSAVVGVYMTTSSLYATWYAARSANGDLYEVDPLGETVPSTTDPFRTVIAERARVARVLRRRVELTRPERRALSREWAARDRTAARALPPLA